ncbi:MAG: hypothetical protein ABJC89_23380, partial [Acidobacteriota bacterium]
MNRPFVPTDRQDSMNVNSSTSTPGSEPRVAELVRTLRVLEEELRSLTGAPVDAASAGYSTLESFADAFFTLDREWRFSYVNSEA